MKKKIILNIQIRNSIQDRVFGSIYRTQKSSEKDPVIFSLFPHQILFSETRFFVWKQKVFRASSNNNQNKNKKGENLKLLRPKER